MLKTSLKTFCIGGSILGAGAHLCNSSYVNEHKRKYPAIKKYRREVRLIETWKEDPLGALGFFIPFFPPILVVPLSTCITYKLDKLLSTEQKMNECIELMELISEEEYDKTDHGEEGGHPTGNPQITYFP